MGRSLVKFISGSPYSASTKMSLDQDPIRQDEVRYELRSRLRGEGIVASEDDATISFLDELSIGRDAIVVELEDDSRLDDVKNILKKLLDEKPEVLGLEE